MPQPVVIAAATLEVTSLLKLFRTIDKERDDWVLKVIVGIAGGLYIGFYFWLGEEYKTPVEHRLGILNIVALCVFLFFYLFAEWVTSYRFDKESKTTTNTNNTNNSSAGETDNNSAEATQSV